MNSIWKTTLPEILLLLSQNRVRFIPRGHHNTLMQLSPTTPSDVKLNVRRVTLQIVKQS